MRTTVTVSGVSCEVEALSRAGMRHYERTNAPVAQVNAADGYTFSVGETSLMVHSARDFKAIERDESLVDEDGNEPEACRVFALCDQIATTTMPHPILGDVPACERCKAKLS